MSDATPLDDAQLADSVLPAGADPFVLFEEWFAAAQVGEINDPNAMALATATHHCKSGTDFFQCPAIGDFIADPA